MPRDGALGRRELLILAAIWAALAVTFLIAGAGRIAALNMPDPDDFLRLQQVRDWLAGQAWFDISQHRINPPAGGSMHWTRLVDLPLALVIVLLRPFIGQPAAEIVASATVPMVTMGVVMALVAAVAARMVGRKWALLAAIAAPISAWVYVQVMPLRVDHHGWQLVSALTMLWALLDNQRTRRSGAIAGIAAAVWLNISIEGMAVVASAGALLGLRYLWDGRTLARLQAFIWAFTGALVLLETATVAQAWTALECDRMSSPYVAAFLVLSVGAWACRFALVNADWRRRSLSLTAMALAAGAAFAVVGPQCLGGPLAALDPLTKAYWFDSVTESWPLWRLGVWQLVAHGGYALFGCAGAAMALRASATDEERLRWVTVLVLSVAAALLMLLVVRAASVAHAFATIGALWLAKGVFTRAQANANVVVRVFGSACALLAATPVPFQALLNLDSRQATPSATCPGAAAALNALPRSVVLAPHYLGPELLVRTAHSVVATGHHRNHAALHDLLSAFTGDEANAQAQIRAHGATYVVLCPSAPEMSLYQNAAPDGFAAKLLSGEIPAWLEPTPMAPGSTLMVFRVLS